MDLGLEYLAGKAIDKVHNLVYQSKLNKQINLAAELTVEAYLKRLNLIASVIMGSDMRVVTMRGDAEPAPYKPILRKMMHPAILPEYSFAWSDGETIYLPEKFIDMEDEEMQLEAAKLAVFFLCGQIKYNTLDFALTKKKEFEADRFLSDVFWILENKRIAGPLFEEFPGLLSSWSNVTKTLLKERPKDNQLSKVEILKEKLLSDNVEEITIGGISGDCAEESYNKAKKITDEICVEYGPKARHKAMVPFSVWGRLVPERLKAKEDTSILLQKKSNKGGKSEGKDEKGKTEKSRYAAKRENINESENEAGFMLNIYDKLLSWAQFVNVRRPFDDDEDKDNKNKADSMEEISVAEVERSTSNYFDAELEKDERIGNDEADAAPEVHTFVYPEWNYKKNEYRENYSRLKVEEVENHDRGFAETTLTRRAALIREAKRQFEAITPLPKFTGRQIEGDEIDLNAAIEAFTDLRSGRQPDDRLYMARPRKEKDLSVLFLMDMSMSTDAWLKSARVIDHEKEALIVLCEALKKHKERYSIYGFSGKTRTNARFFCVKNFDEPYGQEVREKIGGIIPYHYTRMGVAIRHATALLKKEKSSLKLLFVLSDGKPNDVDEYEGRYGIEDTRMAVREAESEGITPFCLTVDLSAKEYLPRLFGRGNYAVVPGVEKLAATLPELYGRITKGL